MSLLLIVTVIGWLLVLIPVTLYLVITAQMAFGVAKDDSTIQGIIGLALLCVVSGVICLALVYATNLIPA